MNRCRQWRGQPPFLLSLSLSHGDLVCRIEYCIGCSSTRLETWVRLHQIILQLQSLTHQQKITKFVSWRLLISSMSAYSLINCKTILKRCCASFAYCTFFFFFPFFLYTIYFRYLTSFYLFLGFRVAS